MQSPSFNRYSSSALEDVAARVIAEFPDQFDDDDVIYIDETQPEEPQTDDEEEEDKEFEFPSLFDRHASPIEPIMFPVFGRDRIFSQTMARRNPLWKLMSDERETQASCSSSEADDLDGVPEETYCVWNPAAAAEAAPGKSRSAGSSKRWKIRDLLFRSNSDGKGNFVFLSHPAERGGGVRTAKIS